jgi:hypothetical protein
MYERDQERNRDTHTEKQLSEIILKNRRGTFREGEKDKREGEQRVV